MQIPGKYDMAEVAKRLGKFMKEKSYEPSECLTEVHTQILQPATAACLKLSHVILLDINFPSGESVSRALCPRQTPCQGMETHLPCSEAQFLLW